VVATDLGHPSDHATAETLAPALGRDQDLQRAERGRLPSSLCEARFDNAVEASVGQARSLSVSPRGNRDPPTDDFLALVVPGVELKLGVFGDHTAEEAFENWVVVQELEPDRPLPEAGRVWEVAGPLGRVGKCNATSRGASHADWTLPPAELRSGSSGDIPEDWPNAAARRRLAFSRCDASPSSANLRGLDASASASSPIARSP